MVIKQRPVLSELTPNRQRRVIRIYREIFVKKETPCAPCGGVCCRGCSSSMGYLRKDRFLEVKERFNFTEKYGFLEPGKGCKLPRNERSGICLGYACSQFSKEDLTLANSINDTFLEQINAT